MPPLLLSAISILAIGAIFAVMVGFLWRLYRSYGVPFVKTPEKKIHALLDHLELSSGDVFVDVGCGDGVIVHEVAKKFPACRAIGYESVAQVARQARALHKSSGIPYEICQKDVFDVSLTEARVVYLYMLPYMHERIWKKMLKECRPGTLLYSSGFDLKNTPPKTTIEVSPTSRIFVYEVPRSTR